ncbi:MAG: hypothetical protein V4696_01420 [Pseudomonadota bacterium]
MTGETTLTIEAEGQPTVKVTIEAAPELVFRDSGMQGPPGGEGRPGADIGGYDPGDLTLIFDNKLI